MMNSVLVVDSDSIKYPLLGVRPDLALRCGRSLTKNPKGVYNVLLISVFFCVAEYKLGVRVIGGVGSGPASPPRHLVLPKGLAFSALM